MADPVIDALDAAWDDLVAGYAKCPGCGVDDFDGEAHGAGCPVPVIEAQLERLRAGARPDSAPRAALATVNTALNAILDTARDEDAGDDRARLERIDALAEGALPATAPPDAEAAHG